MNKQTTTLIRPVLVAGALAVALFAGLGAAAWASNGTVAQADSTSLPRCLNDDYNDGSQARCWSEDVDGRVFVIDSTDTVISVDEAELLDPAGNN